jgi:hypothetical protein
MVTRNDIVDAGRKYLGVPFRKGARGPQSLDCIGLLVAIHKDLGLPIEDGDYYTFAPGRAAQMINKYVYEQSEPSATKLPRHGQIAIMRETIYPIHLGIITRDTGRTMFLNANTKERRVVEQDFDRWKDLLVTLREFKGLES